MKSHSIPCLLFVTISALSSPCQALESIGWNYDGMGDDTLAPEDSAGAPGYAQTNWNNHAGNGQAPGAVPFSLNDNTGTPSGASVTAWTLAKNFSWKHDQSANPDEKLMNSFADRQPALTFSGIPATYLESGYSVVVYYGNNEGPSTSELSIAGSVNDSASLSISTGNTAQSSYGVVGYLQETGELAGPTNYTVFSGLNDPQFTVALTADNNNGICAIQIVREAGAPSAPASPTPFDSNVDVATSISFDWDDSLRATSYEIFIWKATDSEPATPSGTSATSFYDRPTDLDPLTDYRWQVKAVNEAGGTSGPVWSFYTGTRQAPSIPDFPFPESGSTGIPLETVFDWDAAARTATYEFYLWKSTDTKPTAPTAISANTGFNPPGPLEPATTYQWQVVSVNESGRTSGPTWTFSTGLSPVAPTAPSPAEGASEVSRSVTFGWAASPDADSYQIYVWPASGDEPAEPLGTTTATSFHAPLALQPAADYRWRIDSTNAFGTTRGTVWSFSTAALISTQLSIGWHYEGVGDDALAQDEIAGLPQFEQAFWNNHGPLEGGDQGPGPVPFALSDSNGDSTTASVTAWTQVTNNSWFQNQNASPNEKLLDSFSATQPSITFSNLPADYTSTGYTVVVYYGNNEGPSTSTLALAGSLDDSASRTIITGDTAQASYRSIGFVGETGLAQGPTNYTVFTGLNDPSFTLSLTGSNNNGFCAVQIVKAAPVVGGPFDTWAAAHGLSGANAAFDADPDHDGLANGVEFVLGGEPNPANAGSNSTALLPTAITEGDHFVFTFTRQDEAAYLNPVVEFNTGLEGAWTPASDPANATIVVTPGSPADTVTVTLPKGSNKTLFARLKVTGP